MATNLQRIVFNSVEIGDYAYCIPSYEGNTVVRIVPRALGVLIHSTTEMGGGLRTFTVIGLVKKTNRKDMETYLAGLYTSLGTGPSTLAIYDVNHSAHTDYTNCYLNRISPGQEDTLYNTFEIEFIQSI